MTEKKLRTLYRPYGPSIGQTSIPEDLINKINNYIDELIKDEERAKKEILSPGNRAFARKVAGESFVLLKKNTFFG